MGRMRLTALLAPVDDFESGGVAVEPLQHGLRRGRHVTDGIILAHEGDDRIEAVEPHQCLEFDFVTSNPAHQVDMAEARYLPRLDAGNHFAANDPLIGVGVGRRGPSAPQAADHHPRIGISTERAALLSFSLSRVGAAASARWTSTVSPSISSRMSIR